METLNEFLISGRPKSYADCMIWARRQFEEMFSNNIKQLLHTFPPNAVTDKGRMQCAIVFPKFHSTILAATEEATTSTHLRPQEHCTQIVYYSSCKFAGFQFWNSWYCRVIGFSYATS